MGLRHRKSILFPFWLSLLPGPIPPELGRLAKLKVLRLDGNRLRGEILYSWGGGRTYRRRRSRPLRLRKGAQNML